MYMEDATSVTQGVHLISGVGLDGVSGDLSHFRS